jgi:hypothetical protein
MRSFTIALYILNMSHMPVAPPYVQNSWVSLKILMSISVTNSTYILHTMPEDIQERREVLEM